MEAVETTKEKGGDSGEQQPKPVALSLEDPAQNLPLTESMGQKVSLVLLSLTLLTPNGNSDRRCPTNPGEPPGARSTSSRPFVVTLLAVTPKIEISSTVVFSALLDCPSKLPVSGIYFPGSNKSRGLLLTQRQGKEERENDVCDLLP